MKKSNLYTRTGDAGQTSLIGGVRISKSHARLEAYGTLDEFSATIGSVLATPECIGEVRQHLLSIQNMLFNLGCYLATPADEDGAPTTVNGLTEDHILQLEGWIDSLDAEVPPVRAFILPGGTDASARSHVARTVCRRAERRILTLAADEYVDPNLLSYINRLSDYLFVLARWFNFKAGVEEITWRKE